MIRSGICNRRIISSSISFEEEKMKPPGCPGIFLGWSLEEKSKNVHRIVIGRIKQNQKG